MAGRKGEKFWADAVRRAVARRVGNDPKHPQYLDLIADKLVATAMEGDIQAIKEIGDRLDGKARQETDNSHSLSGSLEIVKRIAR